ncbi:MAG TPA: Lrp/AsnC ligand binding domain-containing protein [Actinomycetota bacterium]|nr:Lrp/AsnC ligand binding domain-containing protein [Actinomycetota bacterium]
MSGYVLIEADVGRAAEVTTFAARLAGVRSADEITGPYDVIVSAVEMDPTRFLRLVEEIERLAGVTRTIPCPAGARMPVAA